MKNLVGKPVENSKRRWKYIVSSEDGMLVALGYYFHILRFILVFVCPTGISAINRAIHLTDNVDRSESMSYTQDQKTFLYRNYF
jgi:hypothetical protein